MLRRYDWLFLGGWALVICYLLGIWMLAVIGIDALTDH
jgi:hypothetical protein